MFLNFVVENKLECWSVNRFFFFIDGGDEEAWVFSSHRDHSYIYKEKQGNVELARK